MRIIPAMNLSRNAEGTNAGGSTSYMKDPGRRFGVLPSLTPVAQ